jgi:hypothetical protein
MFFSFLFFALANYNILMMQMWCHLKNFYYLMARFAMVKYKVQTNFLHFQIMALLLIVFVQAWRTQDFYNAKVLTCSINNKDKK